MLKLISITQTTDVYGQATDLETEREIFCDVCSVSSTEFFTAGEHGMHAEYKFTVNRYDYAKEPYVEFALDGVNYERYAVYRTYLVPETDDIELYCCTKGGVYES